MKPALLAFATLAVLAHPAWAAPKNPQCAADYAVNTIDYPGAASTIVFALNNRKQYVGVFYDSAFNPHAMLFDGHKLAPLDPQGVIGKSPSSYAYSINNLGWVAGAYADAAGVYHGYIYRGGQVVPIAYPGAPTTQAYGVDDLGLVIGVYADAANAPHAFELVGGHYSNRDIGSNVTTPLSINDLGFIVGSYGTVPNTLGDGFVRDPLGHILIIDAPGAPANQTQLISINNLLHVVGGYNDAAGNFDNFILVGGKYIPFDLPSSYGAIYVSAQTLNDRDDIVGYYEDAGGVLHGYLAAHR